MTRNQIDYWRLVETERNNRAVEQETNRSHLAQEAETKRSNLAREKETNRSNLAREAETKRSNLAREAETHRANLAHENLQQQNLFLLRLDQEERARSNRAQEALQVSLQQETHRSNVENELIKKRDVRTREINAVTQRAQLEELNRSNRAKEGIESFKASEVKRSNLADEAIRRESNRINASKVLSENTLRGIQGQVQLGTLNEQRRSNIAKETETQRHNLADERIQTLKAVAPYVTEFKDQIGSAISNARFSIAKLAVRAGG